MGVIANQIIPEAIIELPLLQGHESETQEL